MKWLSIIAVLLLSAVAFRFAVPYLSKNALVRPLAHNNADKNLRPCPSDDNCYFVVVDIKQLVDKKDASQSGVQAMQNLIGAVSEHPQGSIEYSSTRHIYATFRTPLVGFIDDVEILLDASERQIQIRSASRLGRSDFGANRQRVDALLAAVVQ